MVWRRAGAWVTAVALLAAGCTARREIRTFEELREVQPAPLRLLAADRSIYELQTYTVLDTALAGSGERIVGRVRSPFTGEIPYREVVYIQVAREGHWSTLGLLGAAAMLTTYFRLANENHGLDIFYESEGSCPMLYAWDGECFELQGEVFGTSFGRGLESATICLLPAAMELGGEIRARLANERPETHYVNGVRWLAYEAPQACGVLLDGEGGAWPLLDPRPPIDSAPELRARDGNWWQGDPAGAGPGTDFRDRVELAFARPPACADAEGSHASVIVHAINTSLVYQTCERVFGYLGDQGLLFLQQVEQDPELIAALRQWIRDCSLTVEILRGDTWEPAGLIPPEASATGFSRIVRIDARGTESQSLRLRLSTLAGGWRIDAVEIDWTEGPPLRPLALPLRAALHSEQGSVEVPLSDADASYALLLPGERIDLACDARPAAAGMKRVYAIEARGYLHEWPRRTEIATEQPALSGSTRAAPTAVAEGDRVAVVCDLIRHRERFLPIVYDRQPGRPTPPARPAAAAHE